MRIGSPADGGFGGHLPVIQNLVSLMQLKMLGVGLGAAVLIDATVVRGIVLPAALALLGERSWYLPRWLGWLPGHAASRHTENGRPVPAR